MSTLDKRPSPPCDCGHHERAHDPQWGCADCRCTGYFASDSNQPTAPNASSADPATPGKGRYSAQEER